MHPVSGKMVISPRATPESVPPIIEGLPPKGTELTDTDVSDIRVGKKGVYVFGKIIYDDMFGIKRETGFCHVYHGTEFQTFQSGMGYEHFQTKYCEKHNYAN
jgi:hypothetical protein